MVTTRNIKDDALALWRMEARGFIDYVVNVASPTVCGEVDEKAMAAFQEIHDEEVPLLKRLFHLLGRLGMRADRPGYPLFQAQYNFCRPETLARAFVRMADAEIAAMKALAEAWADAGDSEVLEERLLKGLLDDWVKLRESSKKTMEKILAAADRARAEAAGEEVEEVEEEVAAGDDEFPWHDEALDLDARMKLAEGKGLFEKLFAAMAQTDCTACGYDCEGYARAIADGEDDDLTKCAPGESETLEMLQKLMGK